MLDELQLQSAARRAYERGRLKRGILEALPVLPMTVLSLIGSTTVGLSLALGVLLAITVVGLVWRGEALGRGVHSGLLAGFFVVVIPVLGRQCQHFCVGPVCWSTCVMACAMAGLAAGVVLAREWTATTPTLQVVGALLVAALAGAMGCLEIGVSGLGLAAGMLAVSGSVVVALR